MTQATSDQNRLLSGGEVSSVLRLKASEIPYLGSVLDFNASGYAERLASGTVGQPFAGIAERRVLAKDYTASPSDGDIKVHVRRGVFFFRTTISGVTIADAADQRAVYASDDNTFTLTPGGTLIGLVWDLDGTDAIVLAATHGHQGTLGLLTRGVKTLAATGTQSLTSADAGKFIAATATAAHVLNLPDPATVAGKAFFIKKTTGGTFTITLTPAAGNIDGAATSTVLTGNNKGVIITSDGTGYWIVGAI